jgi:hypothetical protein
LTAPFGAEAFFGSAFGFAAFTTAFDFAGSFFTGGGLPYFAVACLDFIFAAAIDVFLSWFNFEET